MLEPNDAFESLENALRLIMRLKVGDAWRQQLTEDQLKETARRQSLETRKRPGVVAASDLLQFTDFSQLTNLILADWTSYEDVLVDRERTKAYFEFLKPLRNTNAHNRELVEYERELVSGMVTQLRNQISIYRTEKEPGSKHYPLIESAIDSFGRPPEGPYQSTFPRIEVGEAITIRCKATDARNRELHWFYALGDYLNEFMARDIGVNNPQVGNDVTLTIVPTERDVGEEFVVYVKMRAKGKHQRHRDRHPPFDDVVTFPFAVNPPIE